jgi:hypothetical protein
LLKKSSQKADLHNKGLDILLDAIQPLSYSNDTVFSDYMQAFVNKMDELSSLYDGNAHNYSALKEIYSEFSSAEDVMFYIQQMQNDLSSNTGFVGIAYNDMMQTLLIINTFYL